MKTSRILLITLILVSTLLLSGCLNQLTGGGGKKTTTRATTRATQPELVCNPPYIVSGDDCCLDRNQNNKCDSMETTLPTTEASTTKQTTITTTTARTTQGQATIPGTGISSPRSSTTTLKQQCNQGYYDNDPTCGQGCPARQTCVKSGITIQYAGQTINCYYCKDACPTDDPENKYYYDDPNCGGQCNITGGWYCFQSVMHQGCYLCQKPCPVNYYYKDNKCGDKCAAETQCTKSTQLPDCYWCKSPCPEGYFYKDLECGDTCRINEYCKESSEDCYLCVEGCTQGYYYKDNTCNNTCDEEEGEICGTLLGTQNCYYCKASTTTTTSVTTTTIRGTTTTIVQCGQGLYSTSNCDNQCDSECEECLQYPGWPCYYCNNKPCSQIRESYPLYGSYSDCSRNCSQNVGQCRQYTECTHCYYCYLYECGNGDVEPGEDCEEDADCPGNYGICDNDCQCVPDCEGYCDDQGQNGDGYQWINDGQQGSPVMTTQAQCTAWANQKLQQIQQNCFTSCVASAFMSYNGITCCCVDWNSIACRDCPGQNPVCPPANPDCINTL